jgi:hypothetical protein
MKEYKSIEEMQNIETENHQESKGGSRIRMSIPGKNCNSGNRIQKLFPPMKEYELIEVIDRTRRRVRQASKSGHPVRSSRMKGDRNSRKSLSKLFPLMRECKSIEERIQMREYRTSKV